MIKDANKVLLHTVKLARIGKKFKLKSIEVSESFIKIEFNESSTPNLTKKPSKREKQVLEEVRESTLLEEMQLLDPEAYEEELVKRDGGLKEI